MHCHRAAACTHVSRLDASVSFRRCQSALTCCCLRLLPPSSCAAGLLIGLPLALHGPQAALLGALTYSITQSIVLSATFAVSHNVPESKPLDAGQTQVSSMCSVMFA